MGRKNSLTGRNLQQNWAQGEAAICRNRLGVKGGNIKVRQHSVKQEKRAYR